MAEWVTSGRIGSPQALRQFTDVLQFLDNSLTAFNATARVQRAIAQAELYYRLATEPFGARHIIGGAISDRISNLLGDLLDDSAFFLTHSNLRTLIERYGIAPYLGAENARKRLYEDPVPTQYPTPYTAQWFRTQAARLGSSTLEGLEQPPLESGFQTWQQEVVDAFFDTGDFQRPVYESDQRLAALLITTQSLDPQALFDQLATLIRIFTREPAEIQLPRFSRNLKPGLNLQNALNFKEAFASERIKTVLNAERFNTTPDFVRVSTADFIPLLGDPLLTLGSFLDVFLPQAPQIKGLEEFSNSIVDFIENIEDRVSAATELATQLEALLEQPGFSRLWIDLDVGGTDRIVSEIEAAASTREDLQRLRVPTEAATFSDAGIEGLFLGPYQNNDIVTLTEAQAAKAAFPQIQFTPVENLLVAGVVVVFHEGPLAELMQQLFRPDDNDRNGTLSSERFGRPVVPGTPDVVAVPVETGVPSDRVVGPVGGPVNPGEIERAGTDVPLRGERPAGIGEVLSPGLELRCPTPRATAFVTDSKPAIQLVPGGAPRATELRRVDSGVISDRSAGFVVASESYGVELEVSGSAVQEPERTFVIGDDMPWTRPPERLPIGVADITPESVPAAHVPATPWFGLWQDYGQDPVRCGIELVDGGRFFTSSDLDAVVTGLGYTTGSLGPSSLLAGEEPWLLDVDVAFQTWVGTTPRTRLVRTRVEIVEINDSSGPITYRVFPSLPCYPVTASNSLDAVVYALRDVGFPRVPVAGTGREAVIRSNSPGLTFGSQIGLRPGDILRETGPLTSGLRVSVGGCIVDADSYRFGTPQSIEVGVDTDVVPPQLQISAASPVRVEAGDRLHPRVPLRQQPLRAATDADPGDVIEATPNIAHTQAFLRADAAETYRRWGNTLATDPSSERSVSDRFGAGADDVAVLVAHATRWVRIGLGSVSSAPRDVPAGIVSTDFRIVVRDTATGIWRVVEDAVEAADVGSGVITPVAAFVLVYAGEDWAIELEWDPLSQDVEAVAFPYLRDTVSTQPTYQQGIGDPLRGDYFVTSGDPVMCRSGACTSADAFFSGAGRMDAEVAWAAVAGMVDVSRDALNEQSRSLELEGYVSGPWVGRPGRWVLLETPTHRVVYVHDATSRIELFERTLPDEILARRAVLEIPDPLPGLRHLLRVRVEPEVSTVTLGWRYDTDPDAETPTYAPELVATAVIAPGAPYPYVRALDGFPLSGATIRIGSAPSPVLTQMRQQPYLVTESVVLDQQSSQSTAVPFYLGTPPFAILRIEAAS